MVCVRLRIRFNLINRISFVSANMYNDVYSYECYVFLSLILLTVTFFFSHIWLLSIFSIPLRKVHLLNHIFLVQTKLIASSQLERILCACEYVWMLYYQRLFCFHFSWFQCFICNHKPKSVLFSIFLHSTSFGKNWIIILTIVICITEHRWTKADLLWPTFKWFCRTQGYPAAIRRSRNSYGTFSLYAKEYAVSTEKIWNEGHQQEQFGTAGRNNDQNGTSKQQQHGWVKVWTVFFAPIGFC